MHERYVFNAFVLAMPVLMFAGRRYVLAAALVLTATLFGNLVYSLDYLHVMDAHTPGVDAGNLIPWLSRPFALANVAAVLLPGVHLRLGGSVASGEKPESEIHSPAREELAQWAGNAWAVDPARAARGSSRARASRR